MVLIPAIRLLAHREKETHEYRSININFRVMSMVTSYTVAASGLALEPLGSIQVHCDYARPSCLQIGS